MSKRRVPSSGRKAGRSTVKVGGVQTNAKSGEQLKPVRFVGISLSGGKSDRTCLVFLDYYAHQKKIILTRLVEKIKTEEFISADLKIHELIAPQQDNIECVAFDVPLSLPICVTCKLKCPGYESCQEPEIRFMQDVQQQDRGKKKPRKIHTPYTQRCVEAYLSHKEPYLDVHHALGSNLAPLTARAMFIARRLHVKSIEVLPKLAVWRLGQKWKVNRTHLKVYRNAVGGNEARETFLKEMNVFLYEQDKITLIENYHAFDALMCAYVAYLKFIGQADPRPKGLPTREIWIESPAS